MHACLSARRSHDSLLTASARLSHSANQYRALCYEFQPTFISSFWHFSANSPAHGSGSAFFRHSAATTLCSSSMSTFLSIFGSFYSLLIKSAFIHSLAFLSPLLARQTQSRVRRRVRQEAVARGPSHSQETTKQATDDQETTWARREGGISSAGLGDARSALHCICGKHAWRGKNGVKEGERAGYLGQEE